MLLHIFDIDILSLQDVDGPTASRRLRGLSGFTVPGI